MIDPFRESEANEDFSDLDPNRRILLKGAPNFRDIGGYASADGGIVRWGQIFRSGHLAHLTREDHAALKRIGIRLVCDFRSEQEIEGQPDHLPTAASMAYLHLPIVNKRIEPTEAVARIRNGDISWFSADFIVQSYLQKIDAFADVWRAFFSRLLIAQNRPLVFHCTAGKDRTGVCAALILLTLGVPEETVIQDYGLSNIYTAPFIREVRQEISDLGIDPDAIHDFIVAPRKAITAMIDHLRVSYGSAFGYLVGKVGLDASRLEKFRREMIV